MARGTMVLFALSLAAGCGGGDGAGPVAAFVPIATTVIVSPAIDSIDMGSSPQYTATVLDQRGGQMVGAPISWYSVDPSVITVNATTGRALAVGAGTATIYATNLTVRGAVLVTVHASASVVFVTGSQQPTPFASSGYTATTELRNNGGSGVFYLEYWSLRTSPNGQDRLLARSEAVTIRAGYHETVSARIPSEAGWVLAFTRDPNTAIYRQTALGHLCHISC